VTGRRRAPGILRGFGRLTLDPSPRLRVLRVLRVLRERSGAVTGDGTGVPCPPLPDSAYAPGAVPLGGGASP
jgi:hypothetical protein